MKLSIILPVYNTAPYLRQNLDSILSQVKDDAVELIIVNDGSKDESAVILDEYAVKYSEIQLHHRKNAGVYPTRNFAIKQSSGDYLWMLDSDDYLLEGALDTVMNEIKTHPEVEIFNMGFELERTNGTSVRKHANFTYALCSGVEYLEHNQGSFFLWRNVYKRDFLEEHHLKFEAKVFSLEDTLFNIRAYSKAKRVKVFKEAVYFYRYNENSISKKNTRKNSTKKGDSTIYVHQQLKKDLKNWKPSSPQYQAVLNQLNFSVMGFFFSLYQEKYPLPYVKKVFKIYKEEGILPLKHKENRMKLKVFRTLIHLEWPFLGLCYLNR